jgi:hypothetical protein
MDDMNRRVAELRGWVLVNHPEHSVFSQCDGERTMWTVTSPLGEVTETMYPEESAPDYRHSLDACKELIEEAEKSPQEALFSVTRKAHRLADELKWFAYFRNCWGNQHDYWAEADTIEEAICNAWTKWKEAQNG